MKYRITKYNPKYREENGAYKLNEWTSVGDIGNDFYDTILTKKVYLQTEEKYLNSINIIFENFNCKGITINKMEKYFSYDEIVSKLFDVPYSDMKKIFETVENNKILNLDEAQILATLILREALWCEFIDVEKRFKIQFGYDYYMYCVCNYLKNNIVKKNRGVRFIC